ncbi:43kDa postsynaptic protein [Parasponia andersonii]|uniref:43kDa postsynaptic protein n=1 Tax=Parasponia andersonii TaxID=3476 RepID=A0A2P5DAD8_PARAD|nr:43kDa postsynaptic protein [Parasponia andersonii]
MDSNIDRDYHGREGTILKAIEISLGGLIILIALAIVYYFNSRFRTRAFLLNRENQPRTGGVGSSTTADQESASSATAIEFGLNEATLQSFPKFVFAGAKLLDDNGVAIVVSGDGSGEDDSAACCSICLVDFAESDVLRLLPDCGHVFHVKCVDPWLRLRPTCPNCRTSPLPTPTTTPVPTPITTPLAEVTPLTWQALLSVYIQILF